MPSGRSGVHVEVEGLAQLRRDLKAIDRKLPRELTKTVKAAAVPALVEAKRLAVTPGGTGAFSRSLKLGTRRGGAVLRSPMSGAGIINYGGRHPLFGNRDRWYQQPGLHVVERAVTHNAARIERDLARGVERLMRDAGFKAH